MIDDFVIHMQMIMGLTVIRPSGTILDSGDWYDYALQTLYGTPVMYDSRKFSVPGVEPDRDGPTDDQVE